MKNLTVIFLGILFAFSVTVIPQSKAYAQYDNTVTIVQMQSTTTPLEIQLNTLQKELIVLLNKRVAMLQVEWKAVMEQRLRNLQIQLVGLLQKQVSLLQAELSAKM